MAQSAGTNRPIIRVGSLFSGIGGIDLGLERAGMRVAWQCEIDPYCRRVLAKHWPDVPCYEDVRNLPDDIEPVDLICGGYPCQPFSLAGDRAGTDDPRHLWPAMRHTLRHLRPRYVLIENVPGHLSLGFDVVLRDLAELGFDAEWSIVSACSLGAPHARERLFCVAHANGPVRGRERGWFSRQTLGGEERNLRGWDDEPEVDRMADGLPPLVGRATNHALGNAVVPQVAELIGRRIMDAVA